MIEIGEYQEITQIKLSREINGAPLFWVSAYLVDDILIDTGCTHTARSLLDFLDGRKISRVINTHYHEDHIGANRLLQDRRNAQVFAHEWAIPHIMNPPKLPHYREQAWGRPDGSNPVAIPNIIETERFRFDVIETPGHCQGHIALVEPNRGWTFSGDLFIGRDLNVAGPETNVTEMLRSMKKLLSMDWKDFVLLTSLRTIRKDGRDALSKFVAGYEGLAFKAKSLAAKGMDTRSIVNQLFGQESVFDAITAGQYSSANLVNLLLEAEI